MNERLLAAFCAFSLVSFPLVGAASEASTITGRILDSTSGLPIPNARIELDSNGKKLETTTTNHAGNFTFTDELPGIYTLLIVAPGYQVTRSSDVVVVHLGDTVNREVAIDRGASGEAMQTIVTVKTATSSSLQTSATINESVNASVLQNQNYIRSGDAIGTLPFVTASTSSALGDDLTLRIRGFDSTETATLLDGHPIGPIGAFGSGFDYQVSPFWGLQGANVILGSGATGLYGVPTIAGAVDFQTIDPTKTPQFSYVQGVGTFNKLMSAGQFTGTLGKLGYALASGVIGTDGELGPGQITQTANMTVDANGYPSVTPANAAANTYAVSGSYTMRNNIAKLVYTFSPKTSILFTTYIATSWDDKTGNGDTDYAPYPYVLYNANKNVGTTTINGSGQTVLPNINGGKQVTCNNSYAVLIPQAPGYACFTPQQYAGAFTGPFGGGPLRWQDMRNQDYHGRITQRLGAGTIIVDGFVDAYSQDQSKGIDGPYPSLRYYTHGFLASDEFASTKNTYSFGVYLQHQLQTPYENFESQGSFDLTSTRYYARDTWTPNSQLSLFGDFGFDHSHDTLTTNFDPRVSVVYRPTNSDVVRVGAGRSYSEPDPSLIYGTYTYGAPESLNPVCGPGDLNSIGSGPSSTLKPETASDVELSYGHRFTPRIVLQADAYTTNEQGPLLSGTFPLSTIPVADLPNNLNDFLKRIDQICGGTATDADLGVSTTFNAGSAKYQGVVLNTTIGLWRDFTLDGAWAWQYASYNGINDNILSNNPTLINGAQFYGVPMHQGNLGLTYQSKRTGLLGNITGYYVGGPSNGFNRGPYMYANANLALTRGIATVNFGVYNLFNSIAQQYGFVGLGVYQPENQFGTDLNAFDQGSEEFGLPTRQYWMTLTFHV